MQTDVFLSVDHFDPTLDRTGAVLACVSRALLF